MMTTKAKQPKTDKPAEKPKPDCLQVDNRYFKTGEAEKFKAASDADFEAFSDELTARALSKPEVTAARTIQRYEGDRLNINATVNELREQVAEVQAGNMKRPEAMLVAQAHTLDALFSALAMRSKANCDAGYLDASDRYLRLALKAQAQAVRTIEALGELKNPRPVTFVRQANVANNQQINNHPTQAGNFEKSAEQTISGATYELLENTRASSIESATNPKVEALETIDRAKDSGRQSQGIPERI